MSITIKYAYLQGQVWLYRRNYPEDVRLVLGKKALKRSLKTGDAKVARTRVGEINALYEQQVTTARDGCKTLLGAPHSEPLVAEAGGGWGEDTKRTVARLRATLVEIGDTGLARADRGPGVSVAQLGRQYLRQRADELRPGGYKAVRYSLELFLSKYGSLPIAMVGRDHGREFLSLLPQLSRLIGKSRETRNKGLDELLAFSRGRKDLITGRTQKRIWSMVKHFLDWAVYEGEIEANPFRTVRFDRKIKPSPYAVLTDEEVAEILAAGDSAIHLLFLFCLLTGMRSGEAVGLLREDLIQKGNLGWFAMVRPNDVRELKTEASTREIPLHSVLEGLLPRLPKSGRLFPDLTVNTVTKRFTELRDRLDLTRDGLVFHSTRKWFITQCERTGVPEHWTASLVGHKSARSENQLTYGIYSAGISDEQKRSIVGQLRLPG